MCPQVCDKSSYQRKLSDGGGVDCTPDDKATKKPRKFVVGHVSGGGRFESSPAASFSAPPLRCFTILSRRLFRKTRYVTYWNHHEISIEADQAGCLYSEKDAERIARYAHAQYGGKWILEAKNIDVQPVIGAI